MIAGDSANGPMYGHGFATLFVGEVVELDLNPVFVRPDGRGVVAVDVRMKVAEA